MVAKYLMDAVRNDEVLLKEDGTPLTISDVKGKISSWLAERGAADVEGCIFSIGKDAGVPHSVGTPTICCASVKPSFLIFSLLKLAADIFYDFTRT